MAFWNLGTQTGSQAQHGWLVAVDAGPSLSLCFPDTINTERKADTMGSCCSRRESPPREGERVSGYGVGRSRNSGSSPLLSVASVDNIATVLFWLGFRGRERTERGQRRRQLQQQQHNQHDPLAQSCLVSISFFLSLSLNFLHFFQISTIVLLRSCYCCILSEHRLGVVDVEATKASKLSEAEAAVCSRETGERARSSHHFALLLLLLLPAAGGLTLDRLLPPP